MSDWNRRQFISTTTAAVGTAVFPEVANSAIRPNRSGLAWASGAFDSKPDELATLRGRNLDVITTFGDFNTWAGIRNRGRNLAKLLDVTMGNRQETIVVTYPMFPAAESPLTGGVAVWQAAATGAYDEHHIAAADGLKQYPQNFIFRIGHEWNCCYPWQCVTLDLAPYHTAYFRRIVDIFRASHPTCSIDWCSIKKGRTDVGIDNFYPGSDWVDFVGCDKYDLYPALQTPKRWNQDYMTYYRGGPKGLGRWLEYAKSLNKKLAISEWAIVNGASYGGGDNSYFISRMLQFFADNAADIAYECYFNGNNVKLNRNHRLQLNPLSLEVYKTFMVPVVDAPTRQG